VRQRYRYSTHFPVHRYTRTRILSLHYSYPASGVTTVSLLLQIRHEVVFPSLIPLLPLFCNCQFRKLDSIQFRANILAGWRLETRLFTPDYTFILGRVLWLCPFITPRQGPRRKHGLYCWRGAFKALLHSNRGGAYRHRKHCSSIVVRVYYIATALSLAAPFLHGANTPQRN
jgi:hypothetical protein